jgi:hypothetical protein
MKNVLTALVVALATVSPVRAAAPTPKVEAPRLVVLKGPRPDAKSPGKPSVPVRITSSLAGVVTPEKDLAVTVTVTPTAAAKGSGTVRVRLRTLDGVLLTKGEPLRVPFKALEPLRVKGVVRVPKGVVGLLVVDVLLDLDGKQAATSQSFELAASGATPAATTPGRLVTGSDGQEVLVLEPNAKR